MRDFRQKITVDARPRVTVDTRGRRLCAFEPSGAAVLPQVPPRSPFQKRGTMSEPQQDEERELAEPGVADVPEPDQDPDEDQAEHEAEQERQADAEPDEPQEAQGASEADWEKRFKDADKRFATYEKAIYTIFGDDAHDLHPFSLSPSAPPGFIYGPDAGRIPEEIQRATFEFFGLAREQDYEPDPETRECATCHGKGKTKTGSHVAGRETRACPRCKGTGAEGLALVGNGAVATEGPAHVFSLAEIGPSDVPEADNWGEPRILPDGRENPNFGKQPQFKVLVEPWGVTAQLTAQDAAAGV